MPDIKIFVADDVNEGGLQPLREAGFEVEKRTGLKGDELVEALRDADGLIVRSETKDGATPRSLRAAARDRARGRRR
jgi:D-3-phosphoglycerate dehydrogenase